MPPPTSTSRPPSPRVLEFLDAPNFATISTLDPDGTPRQAVVWYTLDGHELILNSAIGRKWPANLLRDPRIAVAVIDRHDGLRWVGVNSVVRVIRDQATAQADIAGMARRYHADDPAEGERLIRERFEQQERISFRLTLADVYEHLD